MANDKSKEKQDTALLGETFLILPHRISYMLFHHETFTRQLGLVLTALITYAHYADGFKRWKGGHYKCLKGEYIGNYEELSQLTGFSIDTIKKAMKELKDKKVVEVKTVRYGFRVILTGYQQFLREIKCVPQGQQKATAMPTGFGTQLPDAELLSIAEKANQLTLNKQAL
ncbi:MAG: hypothetical protein LUD74_04365 [Tannerellaceae bacterium]|nr:hypothetical protein [Tannerellaceae bacterium]